MSWIRTHSSTITSPPHPSSQKTLLLLTGPPGSCKSTMIHVIAQHLGMNLKIWDEQSDVEFKDHRLLVDPLPYENRLSLLSNFMSRTNQQLILRDTSSSSQLSSIQQMTEHADLSKQIVLMEDLPYLHDDSARLNFISTLHSAITSTRSLIILTLTSEHETDDHTHQLTTTITKHPAVSIITCNPVSQTGLKKALNRIIAAENLSISSSTMTSILTSCQGDVRNAIQSLQFQHIMDQTSSSVGSLHLQSNRNMSKPKAKARSKKKSEEIKDDQDDDSRTAICSGRDEMYSLFHSIGKIIHAKNTEPVETIVERSACDDMSIFMEYIHSNITKYMDGMEDEIIATVYEEFSQGDRLIRGHLEKYGDSTGAIPDSYATSVACRGWVLAKQQQPSETRAKKRFESFIGTWARKCLNVQRQHRADTDHAFQVTEHSVGEAFELPSSTTFTELLPYLHLINKRYVHPRGVNPVPRIHLTADQSTLLSSLNTYSSEYADRDWTKALKHSSYQPPIVESVPLTQYAPVPEEDPLADDDIQD